MHRAVDIKANGTNVSLFKAAMNVIKTEPDSNSDYSLSGSEAVDENSEEDSLGVMLPDVKLETEVRCNLLFFVICFTAGLLNLLYCSGSTGKILCACRQHEIQYTK